jgi:glycosyltransferase involved in cell wall biosynthesis
VSARLNICLFTPSFLPDLGGMEIVLDKLARQFESLGHKVVVIAQRSRRNSEIPQLPYEVVYYPRPRSAVWLLQNVKHVLLREHRKHHFDIVHAHLAYPTGYVAVKLKEKLGVPVVITSHKGDIIPESRYRQRFITRKRMCWAMEKADAVTGVSTELKNIVDELAGGRAHSFYIPNGVDMPDDTAGIMPESCSAITGREFMLTLGRLHHYKGLDVLLGAIKRLCERGFEVPYLVIAGDGKEMQNLQSKAKDLDISDKVIFAGAVFDENKHWLLRNCKFFLQPSRAEGMPLTVLEAMAYGKAVIGTDIKGIAQIVTNKESGILVAPEDVASLTQAIEDLCVNKDIGRIEACAKAVALQMTWPTIAGRYLGLYEQLLK